MEVSVEKTSELSRKMIVSIAEDVVQNKVNERLKSLAREVKIDGFRPGKVPQKVVQKMYGARVKEEITGDLIQTNYVQALQDNDLRPAGMPHIEPVESDEGFTFSAVFEVYPDFSLDTVNTIEVNKSVASIEASDIDAMIAKLVEQKKGWQTSEQDSQTGDEVIFPADYGNEKLAGKPAEFEIEVFKIESPVLPEIDAEFIKAYGIESGDLAEFRADVENNMQRELAQGLKVRLKNSVMDALYDNVSVALPKVMVDQEVESLMKPYYENAKKRKVDVNEIKPATADFEDQAKRRVALGLILAEIIQQNEIKAEANKIRAVIDEMAQSYEDPEQVVNWYYGDQKRLAEVEQMVLEDATVAWVLDKVSVTDEPVSFKDVMETATQQ